MITVLTSVLPVVTLKITSNHSFDENTMNRLAERFYRKGKALRVVREYPYGIKSHILDAVHFGALGRVNMKTIEE